MKILAIRGNEWGQISTPKAFASRAFNIRDMNPGHSMSMFRRDPEMTQG
jgi:hypothetical protein